LAFEVNLCVVGNRLAVCSGVQGRV